jgi:hypothetical protein
VQIKDRIQEVADMEKHPVKLECQGAYLTVSMDGGEAGVLPCVPHDHSRYKIGSLLSSCGYNFTHLQMHDDSCLHRLATASVCSCTCALFCGCYWVAGCQVNAKW